MAIHSFPEKGIDLKNTDCRFYATDCVSRLLDLGGEYSGRRAWAVRARAELPDAAASMRFDSTTGTDLSSAHKVLLHSISQAELFCPNLITCWDLQGKHVSTLFWWTGIITCQSFPRGMWGVRILVSEYPLSAQRTSKGFLE